MCVSWLELSVFFADQFLMSIDAGKIKLVADRR